MLMKAQLEVMASKADEALAITLQTNERVIRMGECLAALVKWKEAHAENHTSKVEPLIVESGDLLALSGALRWSRGTRRVILWTAGVLAGMIAVYDKIAPYLVGTFKK